MSQASRPLRVAIDARLVSGERGGVEQVVIGLASAFSRLADGDEQFLFLVDRGHSAWLEPFLSGPASLLTSQAPSGARSRNKVRDLAKLAIPPTVRGAIRRRRAFDATIPSSDGTIERAGVEVMHFPMQVGFRTNVPVLYTPHDLQHLHLSQFFDRREIVRRETTYRALCQMAAIVVTLSSWAGNDVRTTYGLPADKMLVVPAAPAIDAYARPGPSDLAAARRRFQLPDGYALYPAKAWPHKNHLRLVDAVSRLRDQGLEVPIVLTGSQGGLEGPVLARARELAVEDLMHFVGFVSPAELVCLYRLARILIFPSLFEGWGLPVLEAMAADLPVACSNVTCLPALTAGAAELFDPWRPEAIGDAIARLWCDPALRNELVERGSRRVRLFTWDRAARTYRASYRKLSGRPLSDEDAALLAAPPLV